MRQLFIVIILLGYFNSLQSQEIDTVNFETFNYEAEGQTYVMQQYFLVFLKKGSAGPIDQEEAKKIQEGHLAYLGDLYKKGIICMNGPFGDDGEIRGATVYRVASAAEALRLAGADPAVKAGRLSIEVHPWWLARGSGVR